MSAAGENLFATLRDGLADFRAQLEGEDGRRAGSLGSAEGTIPELVRRALGSLADALTWLAGALVRVEESLEMADSVVALLEVAGDALRSLSENFSFGELPERLGVEPGPFRAVEQAMAAGHTGMGKAQLLTQRMPRPEDVALVQMELEKLLGRRVNPSLPDEGALGKLLARVKKTDTP